MITVSLFDNVPPEVHVVVLLSQRKNMQINDSVLHCSYEFKVCTCQCWCWSGECVTHLILADKLEIVASFLLVQNLWGMLKISQMHCENLKMNACTQY